MFAPRNVALILIASGLAGGVSGSRTPSQSRITFLAVGQGDCVVIQHRGTVVVYDTGGKTEHFDAGQRLTVPGLRALGVEKIDLLVISHPDADHAGGLVAVSRRFRIGKVVVSAQFRGHEEMTKWLTESRIDPDSVSWLESEGSVSLAGMQLNLTAPPWSPGEPENEASLVMKVKIGPATALLVGDGGLEMEPKLDRTVDWQAQVLQASHHGSKTGTSSEWLSRVRPRFTVISCGRGNFYGHPHAEVVRRIDASGSRLFRTDRDGTVTFLATLNGFEPEG